MSLFILSKRFEDFNLAKCTVSTSFKSVLLSVRTSTVATASRKLKKQRSLSSWKVLHFLLAKVNKLGRDFLHCCSHPEKQRDITLIPLVLKHVQRCQVSWMRCIDPSFCRLRLPVHFTRWLQGSKRHRKRR